jgi:hypothetical protein
VLYHDQRSAGSLCPCKLLLPVSGMMAAVIRIVPAAENQQGVSGNLVQTAVPAEDFFHQGIMVVIPGDGDDRDTGFRNTFMNLQQAVFSVSCAAVFKQVTGQNDRVGPAFEQGIAYDSLRQFGCKPVLDS